ncbi:cytochrome c biogenesis heme-transporting ATPase CcmA [Rugamonas sp. FT103W]|uniref:Cytochrome c biogenesis heme-transporting ATPase CcmA n=2 Tax=Rugamonas rivuli TaxID=2743358 RepID=A0A843SHL1_9BURK|nr:cytochrome c biogenesis heme-transporting ATPase CcmA [Rugamonas rivuli]
MGAETMRLQAHRLACARGERQLFSDLNFELQSGEALWLKGGNGSGKTSLLRLLCGLGRPLAGEVRWNGRPIQQLREDYHRQLIYCGHASAVKDDLSAWENVATASTLSGTACSREQAVVALVSVGLGGAADLPARALSQGQRRRVALARLAIDPLPPLLLLDEPFVALDQTAVQSLCRTLNRHLASGGMLIYTTHQAQALQARRLEQFDLDRLLPC